VTTAPGPWPDARNALEDAPCGLLQTEEDGRILWANRTFCRWTGHTLEQMTGGRRLQDLLTMGGRIFHQTHWSPLLRMQGSISEVKLEIEQPGGERLPVIMNATLHAGSGRTLQEVAVYVARDRDKYERELLQARRNLEAAVAEANRLQAEAKDSALFAQQMIGIVSHDLRNPLSAIHMGAVLLTRLGPSAQQQAVIDRIARSTDRANRMISDLLDFTRARLGQGLAVARKPLRLGELVHECVDELRLAFPDRELQLVAGDAEGSWEADRDRLHQLVGNLVANAMAYGDPARPVTVRWSVAADAMSVSVHNHGPPIPRALLETIFLPMTRGENVNASGRSVGLGLYIVSEIAKAHGGNVSVRSSDEEGTEFTATFPRAH
jgi:sigma-B regulation protein RsbU (phosphoserine phosphatase)